MSAIINVISEANVSIIALFLTIEAVMILMSPLTIASFGRFCMRFAKKHYMGGEKNMIKGTLIILSISSISTVIYYGAVVVLGNWQTLIAFIPFSIAFAFIASKILQSVNQGYLLDAIIEEMHAA